MEVRVSPTALWPDVNRSKSTNDRLFAPDRVIELHTFLVTLIRHFDFSLPDNGQEIKKTRTMPVVVGEEHKGPQMPLKVTILGDE